MSSNAPDVSLTGTRAAERRGSRPRTAVLDTLLQYWRLWLGALFLRRESFEYQRDRRDSLAHGLAFIVALGIIAALFGIASAGLRYATDPSADAIKNVVLTHLQGMPFYEQMGTTAQRSFLTGYNQTWGNFGSFFVGYPTNRQSFALLLASVVTTPLTWLIGWLIYGALAHLIASRGSAGTIGRGLGTLALATSPQLLRAIELLPGANISGLTLGLWTLIMNIFALRTAYRISSARAVSAALFPILLLALFLFLLLCLGIFGLQVIARGAR